MKKASGGPNATSAQPAKLTQVISFATTFTVPSTGGEISSLQETSNSYQPAFKHSTRDFSEFSGTTEKKGKT